MLTAGIAAFYEVLPELLNRLRARVRGAEGLTVPATNFKNGVTREARN